MRFSQDMPVAVVHRCQQPAQAQTQLDPGDRLWHCAGQALALSIDYVARLEAVWGGMDAIDQARESVEILNRFGARERGGCRRAVLHPKGGNRILDDETAGRK